MNTKTYTLLIVTVYLLSQNILAQDVITKKDGTDIQAKVSEITSTEVKYKKFENPDGPVYTLLKSQILMIRYENGTKDIFNQEITTTPEAAPDAPVYTECNIPSNSLFLELAGAAGLASINYERVFYKSHQLAVSGRAGVGLMYDLGWIDGSFPVSLNFMVGREKHFFETGSGVTVTTFGDVWVNWIVGYRFQKSEKGLLFRLNMNVMYDPFWGFWKPLPGLSLGYAF